MHVLRRSVFPILLLVVVFCVYAPAFYAPLIFDDLPAILQNYTIRHLFRVQALIAPPQNPFAGRPLVNLSFAFDVAIFGFRPRAFRLTNMLLHVGSALTLWGLIRRTPIFEPRMREAFAACLVLLWAVLPVITETIVYVTQRTELMVSLFFLLTLYAAARGMSDQTSEKTRKFWLMTSVVCCAFGMLSKEIMVVAPLAVWLYDRAFFSGVWITAFRLRPRYYASLGVTWVILAVLVLSGPRTASTGYDHGVSAWEYLLTQCGVILHYLKLCFYPYPLSVAHDWPIERSFSNAWPEFIAIMALGLASAYALWRHPKIGFVAACFFLILAPTSSVLPIVTEVAAERRMYLPSISVLVLTFAAGLWLFRRTLSVWPLTTRPRLATAIAAPLSLFVFVSAVSFGRNATFRTSVSIWRDAHDKFPQAPTSRINYAQALSQAGHYRQALGIYTMLDREGRSNHMTLNNIAVIRMVLGEEEEAVRMLKEGTQRYPKKPTFWLNLGAFYLNEDETDEAIEALEQSLMIESSDALAYVLLGVAYHRKGEDSVAEARLRRAIDLRPEVAEPYSHLGVLLSTRDVEEAKRLFNRAIRMEPKYAQAYANLAVLLGKIGDRAGRRNAMLKAVDFWPKDGDIRCEYGAMLAEENRYVEAVGAYDQALSLYTSTGEAAPREGESASSTSMIRLQNPRGEARAYDGRGAALLRLGRVDEAIQSLAKAIELWPERVDAQLNMGVALLAAGRRDEAVVRFEEVLRRQPDYAAAHYNLANVLAAQGRMADAVRHYREAHHLKPDDIDVMYNLANALAAMGELEEAIRMYDAVMRRHQRHVDALNNMGIALARSGQLESAVRCFEVALQLRPGFADAQQNLERVRAMMGPASEQP